MSNYLCSIYETRPEICRVDVQYKKHYKQLYSWDDFVKLNLKICAKLEEISKCSDKDFALNLRGFQNLGGFITANIF